MYGPVRAPSARIESPADGYGAKVGVPGPNPAPHPEHTGQFRSRRTWDQVCDIAFISPHKFSNIFHTTLGL